MSPSEMSSCREEDNATVQLLLDRLTQRAGDKVSLPPPLSPPARCRPSPCTDPHIVKVFYFEKTQLNLCSLPGLDSLSLRLFLCEHPQDKVGLLRGLKGRGDDQVLAGREAEPSAHLSQVDEGLRACAGRVAQEEILFHVDAGAAVELTDKRTLESDPTK